MIFFKKNEYIKNKHMNCDEPFAKKTLRKTLVNVLMR